MLVRSQCPGAARIRRFSSAVRPSRLAAVISARFVPRRKRLDLLEQVGDRKAELERLQRELDQLVKVKLNQEALIAKLSSAQEEL